MIILDASAVVELLLRSPAGDQVVERLESPDDVVHVPHLLAVEVAQVLRRLTQADVITADRAAQALGDLGDLAGIRHEHEPLLSRMWEMRENLTAYDATYVALAEAIDAPLLTFDTKIANAPGNHAQVALLER